MNILYLEHYVGSPTYGMEFRPYYLSKEWVKQGHNVTIIGSSFSHLRQRNPEVTKDFQEEMIDGIKYAWLKGNAYDGSFSRIRNILSFVWKLQRNVRRIVELYKPDLVIASSTYPLDNIPAHKIAKLTGAKYAYEIHDLWPLSPMLIGGYSKYHPFVAIMQYGEDYAYKHVDKVVSLLWNSEKHCKEHGLPVGRFICVPNGYNPEEWASGKFDLDIPKEHKTIFDSLKGKTIVGFAGGLAASGALQTLVQAAYELRDRNEVSFVLVGKGPEEKVLRKYVDDNELKNIVFLPPVEKKQIPSLISHFDIAYYGGIHSELHKYGTSANKLTDYMLSGKPVVQAIDEPGSVVEQVNCGIRVEAENPKESARAIMELADMSPQERYVIGERGKNYAINNLKWSYLAEKFLASMN